MKSQFILFPSSLRSRLLTIMLSLTALSALLVGGVAYVNARQAIKQRVAAQLTSIAHLKANEIVTWLEVMASDARLMADNYLTEQHFSEVLDPRELPLADAFAGFLTDNMISLQQARQGYSEIFMADVNGRVILSTDNTNIGQSLAGDPVIRETLTSPTGERIQDIQINPVSGEMEMVVSHTIKKVDLDTAKTLEELIGVLVIRVNMAETLYPLLTAWPGMGDTGETLLVRAVGDETLFLNPLRFKADAAVQFRLLSGSEIAKSSHLASRGDEGIAETLDYRGEPVLAAYRHIPEMGWGFVAKHDIDEAFVPVARLTQTWLLATGLGLFLTGAAAVILARALTTPLKQLVKAAEEVSGGNLDVEISIQRADEIGVLSAAIQSMLASIRANQLSLQAYSGELEGLLQLSQNHLETFDIAETLQRGLKKAVESANGDAGALLLVDEDDQQISIQAIENFPSEIMERKFPINAHTAPGYAITRQEPVTTSNLPKEGAFNVPLFVNQLGVRSIMAVPMLAGDRAIGALVVDSLCERQFSNDEIRATQAIANQTALAYERARLFADLAESYERTLGALIAALDARDNEVEGHSQRVVAITRLLAKSMSLPERDIDEIRRGALLHDIGKIGIPDAILHKPGPLDDTEWGVMRQHPNWGAQILKGINYLSSESKIVRAHHERWDGTGYPNGIKGQSIPLGARIFAVADSFDAITSDRPYRQKRSIEEAIREIKSAKGSQFDPGVVDKFLQFTPETWEALAKEIQTPVDAGAVSLPIGVGFDAPDRQMLQYFFSALGTSLKLDEMLATITWASVEHFGAAACAIFFYDDQTDSLALISERNLPPSIKKRFSHLPVEGFHNEQVVRHGRVNLIDSIAKVPAFVGLNLPDLQPELASYLCVPIKNDDRVIGVMGIIGYRSNPFDEQTASIYQLMGEQIGGAISNARLHKTLERQVITDGLTSAYNRRFLVEFLDREIERCRRFDHQFSMISITIDNFERFQQSHGQQAGDRLLAELSNLIEDNIRSIDLLARFGGQEFMIVLPDTGPEGAQNLAEKMRLLISAHDFPHEGITVSLGMSHCPTSPPTDITSNKLVAAAKQIA